MRSISLPCSFFDLPVLLLVLPMFVLGTMLGRQQLN
jgi:hypothetical protein